MDHSLSQIPMSDTPQPQAAKLPNTYDAALLGATVSTVTSDQFAYSLKTLLGLVMLERQCQAPEARQIILAEMIKPYSGMVTFVNRAKVRSTNPGYCYQRAGFIRDGETQGGLPALRLLPIAMPMPLPALPPIGELQLKTA